MPKPHSNNVGERKKTLKLHSRTPSLLQDSASRFWSDCGIRVERELRNGAEVPAELRGVPGVAKSPNRTL
jgi:hypothetical protein